MIVRKLGLTDYETTFTKMRNAVDMRDSSFEDELWILQHNPVYTLGIKTKEEHYSNLKSNVPVIQTDRGGQVTFHGPGQIIIYPIINLRRLNMKVKEMISTLEKSVIEVLKELKIDSYGDDERRGVYVQGKKIASIGLRVRKGCSYHGIALNVDMNLLPFKFINPCGYKGLEVTQIKDLGVDLPIKVVEKKWVGQLQKILRTYE